MSNKSEKIVITQQYKKFAYPTVKKATKKVVAKTSKIHHEPIVIKANPQNKTQNKTQSKIQIKQKTKEPEYIVIDGESQPKNKTKSKPVVIEILDSESNSQSQKEILIPTQPKEEVLIPTQPKKEISKPTKPKTSEVPVRRIKLEGLEQPYSDLEMYNYLRRFPEETDIVARIGEADINRLTYQRFKRGSYSDSETVLGYSEHLRDEFKEKYPSFPYKKFWIFQPDFIQSRGRDRQLQVFFKYKVLKEWKSKIFLVPINYTSFKTQEVHWHLMVFFPKYKSDGNKKNNSYENSNTALVLNSINGMGENPDDYLNHFKRWFKLWYPEEQQKYIDDEWKIEYIRNVPQQGPGTNDCAFYVTYFIEQIIKGNYTTENDYKNVNSWNKKIAENQRDKVKAVFKSYLPITPSFDLND